MSSDEEREIIKSRVKVENKTVKVEEGYITQEIKNLTCDSDCVVCPECITTGLRSEVRTSPGYNSRVREDFYYDESGQYHKHKATPGKSHWFCSKGHRGPAYHILGCPAPNCKKYTINLYTDPYNYKEARKARFKNE